MVRLADSVALRVIVLWPPCRSSAASPPAWPPPADRTQLRCSRMQRIGGRARRGWWGAGVPVLASTPTSGTGGRRAGVNATSPAPCAMTMGVPTSYSAPPPHRHPARRRPRRRAACPGPDSSRRSRRSGSARSSPCVVPITRNPRCESPRDSGIVHAISGLRASPW